MRSEAEILLAIRSDIRGAAEAIAALKETQKATVGVADGFNLAAGAGGALALTEALKASAKAGIMFNAQLEDTQLGLAGIYRQFRPKEFENLDSALAKSAKTVEQLKKAALETTATFGDLLTGYQSIAGAAFAAGIPIERQVRLTQMLSQAVSGLGLPSWQLAQEGRALLTGNIDHNAMVARTLGITNEQVSKAKAQGRLYEFIEQRLKGLNEAGARANQTFSGQWSNLQDRLQQMFGQAGEPAFNALKGAFVQISEALARPEVQHGLNNLGALASAAIRGVLSPGVTGALNYAPGLAGALAFSGAYNLAGRAGAPGGGTTLGGAPFGLAGLRGAFGGLAVGMAAQFANQITSDIEAALDRMESGAMAPAAIDKTLSGRISKLKNLDPIRASALQTRLRDAYRLNPEETKQMNDGVGGSFRMGQVWESVENRRNREIRKILDETKSMESLAKMAGVNIGQDDPLESAHKLKLGRDALEFDHSQKLIGLGTYLNARRRMLDLDAAKITDPDERRRFKESGMQEIDQIKFSGERAETLEFGRKIADSMMVRPSSNNGLQWHRGEQDAARGQVPLLRQMVEEIRRLNSYFQSAFPT
jgi:hypothetical protein